ncbi:MAG: Hpt domain-containing protein, partial [Comamonas sp.]|nr:Hpt domain-containing protein [Candidatus Comamonas equi]
QQQDWKALGMLAHTLKGSLGYLDQPVALQAMESLEWACHQPPVTAQLVHSASQYLQQVLQHIASHLEAEPATPPSASIASPVDHRALMAQIVQALPAIQRGDYAGIRTLEQVEAQLRSSPLHGLAARALALTEDLETDAACDCLQQLHQALAQSCD